MPLPQLPQGTDRDNYTPPPPAATEVEAARLATVDYLKLSGTAQVNEKADPWRPAALGMWADAVEEAGGMDSTVGAMRYVMRMGYRPYCCNAEQDRWSWFDASKKIEEMEDAPSDLDTWLFALLAGGKLEVNFRVYPSGIAALEDVVTSLVRWFDSGRRLDDNDQPIPAPKKEGEDTAQPEPTGEDETDGGHHNPSF